ncbi:Tkp5 protein [Vanderwaltozyma polyspora DSM 70294]|uniref:Tkp5 protein n=1 Tax=Vanderwaltozyma polyspora (strain ATCC 22028 / DSM 70294 / BCRC 21397 / CBS 2163 / NBRC 10782 / NRRL Y-8283 / UCD 57-17) TaxID=436907 RepID=A7TT76_VANPO|nr:Tkp5 protein [Vanderwaltozyma polyspora DSM 70294]EDO14530.1 Tkp5 protein [Vanderwaltozyma polyspora DSM 70294]
MINEIGIPPNTPFYPSMSVVTRPVADIHTDPIRAQLKSNPNPSFNSLPPTWFPAGIPVGQIALPPPSSPLPIESLGSAADSHSVISQGYLTSSSDTLSVSPPNNASPLDFPLFAVC